MQAAASQDVPKCIDHAEQGPMIPGRPYVSFAIVNSQPLAHGIYARRNLHVLELVLGVKRSERGQQIDATIAPHLYSQSSGCKAKVD